MLCEVIAIGGEILKGLVVNSNSTFISKKLSSLGIETLKHTVVLDDQIQIKKIFQQAMSTVDLVVVTGGLGPTIDDITRQVAASLFSSDFMYNEEIAKDLESRYGSDLASLRDQATVPLKARILKNAIGTAPGFIFEENHKVLVLLPGVPLEMQLMLENELVPFLLRRFQRVKPQKKEILYFTTLTENDLDPILRKLHMEFPEVDVGIYPSYGTLTVALQSTLENSLSEFRRKLIAPLSTYCFDSPSGTIEEALICEMQKKGEKFVLAESCTGGLIAHKITLIPGASSVFLGSIVAYSNELKENLLGVSHELLLTYGAVSAQVVEHMLLGIFAKTSADYGIAISGIAGPSGATAEKPIGTVWLAYGQRGKQAKIFSLNIKNRSREVVIRIASQRALGALYRMMAFNVF